MKIDSEVIDIGNVIIRFYSDPLRDSQRIVWSATCKAASLLSSRYDEIAIFVANLIKEVTAAYHAGDEQRLSRLVHVASASVVFLREGGHHVGTRGSVCLRVYHRLLVPLEDTLERAGAVSVDIQAPPSCVQDMN